MVGQYGLDVIRAYMGHIQENAAESVRNVIARLADGEFAYELDNGATIRVKVTVDKRRQDRRPSTSPAPARSSATTSTPRRGWRWRPCCTCSARWSTRTYR